MMSLPTVVATGLAKYGPSIWAGFVGLSAPIIGQATFEITDSLPLAGGITGMLIGVGGLLWKLIQGAYTQAHTIVGEGYDQRGATDLAHIDSLRDQVNELRVLLQHTISQEAHDAILNSITLQYEAERAVLQERLDREISKRQLAEQHAVALERAGVVDRRKKMDAEEAEGVEEAE